MGLTRYIRFLCRHRLAVRKNQLVVPLINEGANLRLVKQVVVDTIVVRKNMVAINLSIEAVEHNPKVSLPKVS